MRSAIPLLGFSALPHPAGRSVIRNSRINCDLRENPNQVFCRKMFYGKILNVAHVKIDLSFGLEPFRILSSGGSTFESIA